MGGSAKQTPPREERLVRKLTSEVPRAQHIRRISLGWGCFVVDLAAESFFRYLCIHSFVCLRWVIFLPLPMYSFVCLFTMGNASTKQIEADIGSGTDLQVEAVVPSQMSESEPCIDHLRECVQDNLAVRHG